ncbi:MAG: recombinase family protein [Lachnospiraceae bacterium]|nr:recombinase family protein [Lachnospiraceae bacterium]
MLAKQDKYIAALYCRLSQDDGQVGESGSIQTQKTLLTSYAKANGYEIFDCFCDDGFSGTNFDRPAFKRMIKAIDDGKVNMVIVKDLSRFGREYAQMGLYIEHYFEEKSVRFIALGENIDTLNGVDNILMPITNVINSMYARDCSRKTKVGHRTRAMDGKYLGSHAPFGYLKDPSNHHHLIVDIGAAEVVREIFKMFSEGIGYVRITKILRERNILNPQAYFNRNNPDFYKSDYWRQPFDWHATSIRSIISNPVYLGHIVFGRTKIKGFYDKTRVKTGVEDWILVENMHEPLITQQTWDTVQKLMQSRRRETVAKEEIQYFAGLVKCSDCGSSLNVSYDRHKGKYTGFSCWVYKNYGKQRCTSHAIGWKTLNQLVLEDIQRNAQIAKKASQKYMDGLIALKTEKQKKEVAKYRRELTSIEKRLRELDKILNKLYEDNALDKISDERYATMSKGYENEQEQLQEQSKLHLSEIEKADEIFTNAENFVKLIESYTDVKELNTKILNELIDRIVVHEKTENSDGSKSQRVDIYYKFIGYISLGEMKQAVKVETTKDTVQKLLA